jgi:RHS repeat-associated protein
MSSGGTTYSYRGGIVYASTNTTDQIEQIATAEGRWLPKEALSSFKPDGTKSVAAKYGRYEFMMKDHLGNNRLAFRCIEIENATAITQAYPAIVTAEYQYDAWGLSIENQMMASSFTAQFGKFAATNRYKYNDKEYIGDSKLYDYGARHYDPVVGRWWAVDPLAELDFGFSSYTYVGNNPMIFMDPNGMKKKKVGNDGDWEETDPLPELVVSAKRDRFNEAMGFDKHYQYLYYHSEDANYRKVHDSFVSGGNIAAGVAALPVAAIGAAEVGIGAIVSRGASYLARINYAGAGRWLLRKSIFILKPRIGLNSIGATADFGAQFLTNGYSLEDVNYWSVVGNLALNNPLWSGAITTISADKAEDRTFTNFIINSGGNALGNSPGLLLSTYSKVGIKTVTAAGAIPRANFMGNIVSRGVAESAKNQKNDN